MPSNVIPGVKGFVVLPATSRPDASGRRDYGKDTRRRRGMSERRIQKQAVELSSRLADAICLLIIHGIISDAERNRAYKRLDVWAQKGRLKRKGLGMVDA